MINSINTYLRVTLFCARGGDFRFEFEFSPKSSLIHILFVFIVSEMYVVEFNKAAS